MYTNGENDEDGDEECGEGENDKGEGVYTNGEIVEDGNEECGEGENDKGEGVCGDDFFFWIVADDGEKALVELYIVSDLLLAA